MKTSKNQKQINHRWKLLNREAALISGLLSNGLYHLKRIHFGDHEYYSAFYNLSTGLERMLKLLLFIQGANYKKNHDLESLLQDVGFTLGPDSVEQKIITFLSDFAKGDRYTILDDLSSGSDSKKEPIKKFYEDVMIPALDLHSPRTIFVPPADFPAYLFSINEDFSETNNFQNKVVKDQLVEFVSKYIAMYVGRILHPIISEINKFEGNDHNNPYFSEHFVYLDGDDQYFKTRKTFASKH